MFNMPNNPATSDYKDTETICLKYHQQLVPEFEHTTTKNISQRVHQTVGIINKNKYISKHIRYHFNLDINKFVTQSMTFIIPIIKRNTLVDLSSCKTIPKSLSDYRKIARNRLNRNKPRFIGNFVFGPLIFDQLYKFCGNIFNDDGIVVFVSILSDILSPKSLIRFEQTRAQPLIPHNSFVMENAFKTSCIALLRHYRLETQWDVSKKKTAKDKWYYYITECLPKVSERCTNQQFKAPMSLFHSKTPRTSRGGTHCTYTTETSIVPMHHKKHQHMYTNERLQSYTEYHSNTNHNEPIRSYTMNNDNTYIPPSVVPMQQHRIHPHVYTDAPLIDTTSDVTMRNATHQRHIHPLIDEKMDLNTTNTNNTDTQSSNVQMHNTIQQHPMYTAANTNNQMYIDTMHNRMQQQHSNAHLYRDAPFINDMNHMIPCTQCHSNINRYNQQQMFPPPRPRVNTIDTNTYHYPSSVTATNTAQCIYPPQQYHPQIQTHDEAHGQHPKSSPMLHMQEDHNRNAIVNVHANRRNSYPQFTQKQFDPFSMQSDMDNCTTYRGMDTMDPMHMNDSNSVAIDNYNEFGTMNTMSTNWNMDQSVNQEGNDFNIMNTDNIGMINTEFEDELGIFNDDFTMNLNEPFSFE